MLKLCWLWVLLCIMEDSLAQIKPLQKIRKNTFSDSANAVLLAEDMLYDLPVIAVNENERTHAEGSFIPSLLSSNRDVVVGMAAFHFNSVRFRLRGYDASFSETTINGISMNNPDDGFTQFAVWNGLNEVTRNTQSWLGLRNNELSFGNIGNNTAIDMRASKQRTQKQFSYAFSNRRFTHRWMFTNSSPMLANGWAYSVSASWYSADKGTRPGTSNRGASYFIGIDKRIDDQQLISLLIFGSSALSARQSAILEEAASLAGTNFYNPNWGYQSGKIRNANMASTHLPVCILTHTLTFHNQSSLTCSFGAMTGKKYSTTLDWYHAPDPRPDYYRYLPSYQKDSAMKIEFATVLMNDPSLLQINWDHLFSINRSNITTTSNIDGIIGNSFTGSRSHYILAERVNAIRRFELATVFHAEISPIFSLSLGTSFQKQYSRYYKKVNDLLGGDYYLDLNQFAESDFPLDELAKQNDLNHPNKRLVSGDIYGYDYAFHTQKAKGWLQIVGTKKRIDFFGAMAIDYTFYQRKGFMRNGLFPEQSYGKSTPFEFTNFSCKGGITYKINGRKYVYLLAAAFSKAPLMDDVLISPRTRDSQQENIVSKKIFSLESGYVWNAPSLKLRLSSYLTKFMDGMNVVSFYHDGYQNFVNYALSGMNKLHFGCELGMELKLSNQVTIETVAAIGRYYDQGRQQVTVTLDNDAKVIEQNLIYSNNFRVDGTPQEAYGCSIRYQTSFAFYANLTASIFRQQWLAYNPMRRTYDAVANRVAGSDSWNQMIWQLSLPVQSTIDFSAGTSIRTKLLGSKNLKILLVNMTINNLLNNQHLIAGGYEQLRFDVAEQNTNKFPPKYFYAMGLNFSVNLTLRL